MTELYIDGIPVVLPPNFEITVTEENTFLTKSGEYTYDTELSLMNDTNAQLYQHINRMNSTASFTKRKAILIVDNRVLLNGIENILEITNKSVKLQLLSGNAELNFVGSNQKVSELDLGEVPTIGPDMALDSLLKFYGQGDFVFAPLKTDSAYILNPISYAYRTHTDSSYIFFDDNAEFVPQPYLMYYVNKICEVLGFNVMQNELEGDFMVKRLYIVNTIRSTYYKDFLPTGWSVSDFITEVEKLFNAIFIFDRLTKNLRILKRTTNSIEKVYIEAAKDDFTESIDTTNSIEALSYDFVEYNLPSTTYYEYAKLNDDAKSMAVVTWHSDFESLKAAIGTNWALYNDKKGLFHVSESDNYYIVTENKLKLVDIFRSVGTKTKNNILFKIIPAQIVTHQIPMSINYYPEHEELIGVPRIFAKTYTLPLVADNITSEDQTFPEIIESGKNKTVNNSDVLPVAIYFGLNGTRDLNGDLHYDPVIPHLYPYAPWSQNDIYLPFGDNLERIHYIKEIEDAIRNKAIAEAALPTVNPSSSEFGMYMTMLNESNATINDLSPWFKKLTLRLPGQYGLYNRLYSGSTTVESKKKYEIDFLANNHPDPRAEFIINNKSFICEKLEYKITSRGFDSTVKGYFYPKL
ncbi:MAG: hypothetical protein WCJ03_03200 [Bacteroidales bacterium]